MRVKRQRGMSDEVRASRVRLVIDSDLVEEAK